MKPAPNIARKYWRLGADSTLKDVIYAIRADEAHHRHDYFYYIGFFNLKGILFVWFPRISYLFIFLVLSFSSRTVLVHLYPNLMYSFRTINHTLAELKSTDENPFPPGREPSSH